MRPTSRTIFAATTLALASLGPGADPRLAEHTQFDVSLAVPVADVWTALTNAEALAEWSGGSARVDLHNEGAWAWNAKPGAAEDAADWQRVRILAWDPERMLSTTYFSADAPQAALEAPAEETSWVTVTLSPADGGAATAVYVDIFGPRAAGAAAPILQDREFWLRMQSTLEGPDGLRMPAPAPHPKVLTTIFDLPVPLARAWDVLCTAEGWNAYVVPFAEGEMKVGAWTTTSYSKNATVDDPNAIRHQTLALAPQSFIASRFVAPPNAPLAKPAEATWGVSYFREAGPNRTMVESRMIGWGEDEASTQAYNFFAMGNKMEAERMAAKLKSEATPEADAAVALLERLLCAPGEGWLGEGTASNGRKMRTYTRIRRGPGEKNFHVHGFTGGENGPLRPHASTLVWLDPSTRTVQFRSLQETGSVAAGTMTVEDGHKLVWDWNDTMPDGAQFRYRVVQEVVSDDQYLGSIEMEEPGGGRRPVSTTAMRRTAETVSVLPFPSERNTPEGS